jgi:EmrB/QacA subfamily drug resistance transporter
VTRSQLRILVATILGSSMAFADGTIVTVAIPRMRIALEASLGQMQWVANGYTLTLSAFLLLGGAAGDRYGLRRVYGLGVGFFAAASLACALSGDVLTLIGARALQGLAAALLAPGSLALLSAHFPASQRGRAIGAWAASTSVAAALGPLLGGWLIDHAPWRAIFLINLPIAALAIFVLSHGVDELPKRDARAMDWPGALLAVASLGAVTFGLTWLGEIGAPPAYPIAIVILGAALFALFLVWESFAPAPMAPLRLFARRQIAGVNALTFFLYFALAGMVFFLPSTLINADGWSAAEAGSTFLAFTLMMAILSRLGGTIADRFGVRGPLSLGPAITAVSFLVFGPAVANGGYWSAIIPAMLLLGLGMGLTVAPLSTAVMNGAPEGQTGVVSAINNAVARVGGLLAVASLGIVAGAVLVGGSREAALASFSRLTLICATASGVAALVAFVTLRDEPETSAGGSV